MAKRTLRILAAIFVVLVIFILLVVPITLLTIRSQAFIGTMVPRVQQVLKKEAGVDLVVGQLKLDLVRHIVIRNTTAKLDDAKLGKIQAQIGEVNLRFSLWSLLRREIVVEKVLLSNLKVDATLKEGEEPPSGPPSNPIALLAKLIENPPVGVSIPKIEARNLTFHITMLQRNGGEIAFHAEDLGALVALSLEKGKVESDVAFKIGSPEKPTPFLVSLKNPNPKGIIEAKCRLALGLHLNIALSKEESAWNLKLADQSFAIGLDDLRVHIEQTGETLTAKIASLRVEEKMREASTINLTPIFALQEVPAEQFNAEMQKAIDPFLLNLALKLKSQKTVNLQRLSVQLVKPQQSIEATLSTEISAQSNLSLNSGDLGIHLEESSIALRDLSLLLKPKGKAALAVTLREFGVVPNLKLRLPLSTLLHPPKEIAPKDAVALLKQLEFMAPLHIAELKQDNFELDSLKVNPSITKNGEEAIELLAQLVLQGVRGIPANLVAPVSVDFNAKLAFAKNLYSIETLVNLANEKLLKLNLDLNDSQKQLSFNNQTEVTMLPILRRTHSAAAILDDVGLFHLKLSAQGALQHPATTMLAFKPEMLKQAKVNTNFNLALEQTAKPMRPQNIDLRLGSLALDGSAQYAANGDIGAKLNGSVNKVKVKDILRPIDSGFNFDLSTNLPLKQYNAKGSISIDRRPTVELKVRAHDTPKLLKALGDISIHPSPDLATLHPAAKDLAKVGNMDVEVRFDAKVAHPFQTLQTFDPKQLAFPGRALSADASVAADLKLPAIHTLKPTLENAKLLTYLKVAEPYLRKIQIELAAKTDLQTQALVQHLKVNTGENRFAVSAEGQSDLKGENVDLAGSLELALPPTVPLKPKMQLEAAGRVRVPWKLRRVAASDFQLEGEAELQHVAAKLDKIGLSELNGAVAFAENLRLSADKTVSWSRLLDLSPFLRVDTSRIRPYLANSPVLRIGSITAMDRSVGPLRARIAFTQNQLALDEVDLSLFDGVYAGQIFINVHPQTLQLALLGRLTGLDTALLNPAKRGDEKDSNRFIAARLATIVDVNRSLAEGRVDINEIGGEQLKALIRILDPEGKDSTLNAARAALSAAYPKYVGLRMEQGFLDLAIQLGGAAPIELNARQLPLTAILTPYTYPILTSIREVPLR